MAGISHQKLDPLRRAQLHALECNAPAVDFFQGALLGNGGMGVVVTTRPDAVALLFGHNNVWDIRVAENHADQIGTFAELFKKIESICAGGGSVATDPWLKEYCKLASENYGRPYPRPFPCGMLILNFDRRRAELLGHRLDISSGTCDVRFLIDGRRATLRVFVDQSADRLWMKMIDEQGRATASPFNHVRLIPHDTRRDAEPGQRGWGSIGELGGEAPLPPVESHEPLTFRQLLPARPSGEPDPRDKAVRVTVAHDAQATQPFIACAQLDEGLAANIPPTPGDIPAPTPAGFDAALQSTRQSWAAYWEKSGVALDDSELEAVWYRNLYFLNCAARSGVACPGLFANWSFGNIGTAWHGDYHMNYNTQQPFWVTFSSNHVEKHLPYVELVEHLMPLATKWAREYYGLRGAYFPHSAYPITMNVNPYPVPTWGWEVCETPWTVQSLWWHYLYTMDEAFLRDRAFGPIRQAVLFLVDYMTRPDAHGPRWNDNKFHIFPTVVPELYGLTDRWEKNADCLVDLTLTKFVLNAFLKACDILGIQQEQAALIAQVRKILDRYPEYPTAESSRGRVFVSVRGEDPDVVFNTPNPLMSVFPGEEHGLDSPREQLQLAVNTYRNQRNEGGNELVFLNLQAARLGLLDLEKFKRQIRYCTLPNGTCTDMVLQTGGRYDDAMPFDFMARMGIWFENFALPTVINECLMQSYDGTIRLFPNWPADKTAQFRTLRAAGAFLVSAAIDQASVQWVEVESEAGSTMRLLNPWDGAARCQVGSGERILLDRLIEMSTRTGQKFRFTAVS